MHRTNLALKVTVAAALAGFGYLMVTDIAGAQYAPPAVGGAPPGYTWREQRTQGDWRNNTWREDRTKSDWRNNTWQEQRTKEDLRARGYANPKEPKQNNNAADTSIDKGYGTDCGVGPTATPPTPCR